MGTSKLAAIKGYLASSALSQSYLLVESYFENEFHAKLDDKFEYAAVFEIPPLMNEILCYCSNLPLPGSNSILLISKWDLNKCSDINESFLIAGK